MKRILIILIMMLCIFIPVSADRIQPTWDLGLFLDLDLFEKALQNTPVYNSIYEQEMHPYNGTPSKVAKYVKEYRIEGDAEIICIINKYGKIHGIRITMAPWYLLRDDCYEMYELAEMILKCTGLVYISESDKAIEAAKTNDGTYTGTNFYLKRYVNETDLSVDIMSIYDVYQNLTPYKRMDYYNGPCDSNYVGACVPIVSYDLDCTDIWEKNFFVVGTDKHKLDGDKNGVCCEPYPK